MLAFNNKVVQEQKVTIKVNDRGQVSKQEYIELNKGVNK
jgi:hypothetical protein